MKRAPVIWLSIKRRAEQIKKDPLALPQSTMVKAVRYSLNEYTALVGYLRDGRFLIDNNLVENDVRPAAVGRRRWLFIGHPDAGWRSAVIYTIIQTCRRRGINTQEYLTDVLRRLPAMKSSEVVNLVPSRWKPQPPPAPLNPRISLTAYQYLRTAPRSPCRLQLVLAILNLIFPQ